MGWRFGFIYRAGIFALVLALAGALNPCGQKNCSACGAEPGCSWLICSNDTVPACRNTSLLEPTCKNSTCTFGETEITSRQSTLPTNISTTGAPTPHNSINTSKSVPAVTTAALSVSVSTKVMVTTTVFSRRLSKFDIGSFVGGIVLAVAVMTILYFGCKFFHGRHGIRYSTIEEHDAII
ncbi:porimin isoform X1 [Latimeria chalumnae]|uniref:porimin isoform X1 n=1 Tax=Latimeria chalumnae TaxID=7897 RepID=UPI0006D90FC5|nr:PREDICTED: porimin [Latimeria chalumnae]|eukprot:XP_014339838.1 PREDICTED: porimin [Latimeria chalumnae]